MVRAQQLTWFVVQASRPPDRRCLGCGCHRQENLHSGLVRKYPSGKYGCLQRGEPDGLTHTFYHSRRLDLHCRWQEITDYDLRAEDFVFAFWRLSGGITLHGAEFQALSQRNGLAEQKPDERTGSHGLSGHDAGESPTRNRRRQFFEKFHLGAMPGMITFTFAPGAPFF